MSNNYEEFRKVNHHDNYVDDVVNTYKSGKAGLHVVGAQVLFHMFTHGDVGPINKLWRALGTDSKEFKKFKVWAGDVTRLKDDGEIVNTLSFKKDEGFRLVKNTGPARKLLPWINDYDKLEQSCNHFLDFKADKPKQDPTLHKMLKKMKSLVSKVTEDTEEFGVPMPDDIKKALELLSAKVELHIESSKDEKNVNIHAEGLHDQGAEDEGDITF